MPSSEAFFMGSAWGGGLLTAQDHPTQKSRH